MNQSIVGFGSSLDRLLNNLMNLKQFKLYDWSFKCVNDLFTMRSQLKRGKTKNCIKGSSELGYDEFSRHPSSLLGVDRESTSLGIDMHIYSNIQLDISMPLAIILCN